MQKDGRVLYLTEDKNENRYWNIPIANTTCLLLGTGTSITQAAMRMLASAGVLVGFCGGGGTPLLMATEIEWLTPQSEYRPTEYLQGWLGFWFDEAKRLKIAKNFQRERIDFIQKVWSKDRDLIAEDFDIKHSALVQGLQLIVSHHRLPNLQSDDLTKYSEVCRPQLKDILESITFEWGYKNLSDDMRLSACFDFPQGLLNNAVQWQRSLKKWSSRLLEQQVLVQEVLSNDAWRVVLHHARLSLMLGDHFYTSCDKDTKWQTNIALYANTTRDPNKNLAPKQKLDEHLVRVSDFGLKVSQSLSRFSHDMESAHDVIKLKQKSPTGYEWQDKAVVAISQLRSKQNDIAKNGWFIVNMASTGCGKTIANAKIMRALSADADSLRFILALGLRTLTLQTGDEYRDNIGLANDELAVLIGSSAVMTLHNEAKQNQQKDEFSLEDEGAESSEELLTEELVKDDYEIPQDSPTADFLNALIPISNTEDKAKVSQKKKNKAFLYKPVLACTIDHIIAATETTRGGRYILPCLRLLSSDLVIDEVDDFDGQDLVAIGRLIHLAGMLGRKVMIS